MRHLNIKTNVSKLFFCIVVHCCALCEVYSSQVDGNIPNLERGVPICLRGKPKAVKREDKCIYTIDVRKGFIEDAKTHKNVNRGRFLPIIDSANYVKSNYYNRLQRWWEYKNEFILSAPPVLNRAMSSEITKVRLQEAKEKWLYFEVLSQGKTWRFACYIPNWPGLVNVPSDCSNAVRGLLFFPAYPKRTLGDKGVMKDNCLSSACWINFSQDMLSFFSIYLVFSINLKEKHQTFSLDFYKGTERFVFGHHYLLQDSVLQRFDVYYPINRK